MFIERTGWYSGSSLAAEVQRLTFHLTEASAAESDQSLSIMVSQSYFKGQLIKLYVYNYEDIGFYASYKTV